MEVYDQSRVAAVRDGVDIIPTVEEVRRWSPLRHTCDTERCEEIRLEIAALERLATAYRENRLRQQATS